MATNDVKFLGIDKTGFYSQYLVGGKQQNVYVGGSFESIVSGTEKATGMAWADILKLQSASQTAPTPDTNDPFDKNAAGTETKGDALSQAGAGASQGDAAALNQVTGTPYKSPLGTGGEFSSATSGNTAASAPDPMDALVGAYQDALRAGTQQTAKLIQNMTQEQSRANAAMQHNAAALNMLVAQSTEAQKQSADVLAKTLAGIGSGNKAAQTQYSATDVSEQMAQTQNDRKRLRASASGTAKTKKTGLLAQKALLSQPTLLGS